MRGIRHLFLATAIGLGVTAWGADRFRDWVGATLLPPLVIDTSVEVVDRDGQLLRAYTVADGLWRLPAPTSTVDTRYLDMLIAYEDKRFFTHRGVDMRAVLRAGVQALWRGRIVSGGSTITMQVARLLEDGGTGKWRGKLRQARVALALESRLSKTQILDLYLMLAPYGGNLEGVRAATLAWFGKEPTRLTPAQAALLVALPQAPESRRPDRNRNAAAAGRDRVLSRAVSAGVLPADEAEAARSEPIPVRRHAFPQLAPHLADRLRRENPVATRITTTLRKPLQRKLEQLAVRALDGQGARMSVAMMVADHQSGEVLATVGSARFRADERHGFVDMTRAKRSPGSTLKPLIYALAFDDGILHPETMVEDRPSDFAGYRPQNFDKHYRGTLRVREALQQSLNIPVVAVLDELGPARLMSALRRLGATPVLDGEPGLAIGLGGIGLSLEDLVTVYGGMALGPEGPAMPELTYVTGSHYRREPVVGGGAAWHVADILAGVAPPSSAPEWRLPYKTGTSYGHRDAWALGWDGAHVAGVWMGRPDGTPVPGAFGGELAAPVLFELFARVSPRIEPLAPPPPDTLIVSNARLPQPLQQFAARGAALRADADTPVIAFPPDGAELATDGALVVKVKEGQGPFTWLADGRPVAIAGYDRQVQIEGLGAGFVTLSVIDAEGRADRARVFLH